MRDAAIYLEALGIASVDINMGCPVRKVCRVGGGSAMMTELAGWYGEGKIKPVIDGTMPMAELKAAYARMGSREVKGKLVMVN